MGLILLWESFLLRTRLFIMFWSLFWKLGANFGPSSSHLSNFERILRSNKGHMYDTCYPKSWINLCKASFTHPPILVEQARGLVSKSPTLLLTDDSLSVKKAWVTLCLLLLINSRFETKPMHGFIHFGLWITLLSPGLLKAQGWIPSIWILLALGSPIDSFTS